MTVINSNGIEVVPHCLLFPPRLSCQPPSIACLSNVDTDSCDSLSWNYLRLTVARHGGPSVFPSYSVSASILGSIDSRLGKYLWTPDRRFYVPYLYKERRLFIWLR